MPTIHALDDGYDVYVVTDASGGVSAEGHDMAVRRMIQAGAVPITWFAVGAELQRDWAREATVADYGAVGIQHGGRVRLGNATTQHPRTHQRVTVPEWGRGHHLPLLPGHVDKVVADITSHGGQAVALAGFPA